MDDNFILSTNLYITSDELSGKVLLGNGKIGMLTSNDHYGISSTHTTVGFDHTSTHTNDYNSNTIDTFNFHKIVVNDDSFDAYNSKQTLYMKKGLFELKFNSLS